MLATPRGMAGVAIAISFTAVATVTLVARLYTRYILVKNPGREELAILFAWAFSLVHTVLVGVQVSNGLGDHVWNISAAHQEQIYLPFWISVPMYSIALFLTKVSILLLYIRLFPTRSFVQKCWAVIIIMGIFLQWTVFGFMFMCRPVSFFWNRSMKGHCMNSKFVYFTNAPFNILTDFVLFGLPLPILSTLQLPPKQKYGLMFLFAIALVGCLTSILRLRSLYYLSISTDITHDNLDIAIWSCVEVNVGICCACVPTLKPLITLLVNRIHPVSTSNKSKRATAYTMEPLDIRTVLSNRSHGLSTYVQFDAGCEIKVPEAGKVKVTTSYQQS